MAADDAAVVVTLRANLKDYEAALKSAVRATERAATAAEKAISNVGKSGGASNVIQANFQKSASAITNDARQLQFQLNDIFSGIASGQGIRAVQQQLGQIAQQLSGGSLIQGARTMGAALVGMVNPINLAVVAFGFLASAAAEYFLGAEEDAEKANKALADHAAAVRKMADTWGDMIPGLEAVADELERIAKMQSLLGAAAEVTSKRMAELGDEVQKLLDAGGDFRVLLGVDELKKAGLELIDVMKDGKVATDEYATFQKQLADLLGSDAVKSNEALAKAIQALATAYTNAAMAASQLHAQEAARAGTGGRLQQGGLSDPNFNARFGQRYGKTNEELFPELFRQREAARRKAESASKKAADEAAREAEKAADRLTRAIANQSAAAVDAAATMLDMSETANRGEINAFLQSAGINLDAASTAWCAAFVNASLARVGIKGSGSNIATDFLNFGKGVDLAQIQKGDILVQARGHAAGEAGGHVGFATGQIRATAEGIQQVEMLSGNASDKVQKDWVDASGVVARRASDAFELPAGALDHLTAASDTAKTKLSEVEQAALDMQKAMQGAVSGLIKDLIDGKDASEALSNALGKVADAALQIGLNSLFSMGGPGAKGGILGGMLIPGVLHKGGIAGADGYGSGRVVPASTFRNARRYHSGGLVGGEVPAILQRGEIVIPRGSKVRPAGSHDTVSVNLRDDTGRMADIADQRIATASGTIVAVSVQKSSQQVVPTVGRYQAQQANSDYRTRR